MENKGRIYAGSEKPVPTIFKERSHLGTGYHKTPALRKSRENEVMCGTIRLHTNTTLTDRKWCVGQSGYIPTRHLQTENDVWDDLATFQHDTYRQKMMCGTIQSHLNKAVTDRKWCVGRSGYISTRYLQTENGVWDNPATSQHDTYRQVTPQHDTYRQAFWEEEGRRSRLSCSTIYTGLAKTYICTVYDSIPGDVLPEIPYTVYTV